MHLARVIMGQLERLDAIAGMIEGQIVHGMEPGEISRMSRSAIVARVGVIKQAAGVAKGAIDLLTPKKKAVDA